MASSAGYDEFFPIATSNASVASVSGGGIYLRAGMTSVNFQITTAAVTSSTPVTISTNNGGASQSATLTVNPSGAASPTLSSFTVSPTSVTGGTSATGTVRLSSAAPTSGAAVSLGSNLPNVADRSVLRHRPGRRDQRHVHHHHVPRGHDDGSVVGGHQQLVPVRGPDRERRIVAAASASLGRALHALGDRLRTQR